MDGIPPNTRIPEAETWPGRKAVEINNGKSCHGGQVHGDQEIPRLSLHGGNRNEELGVCVICHNPNQTDIPYRTSGPEESVDLKRLVHGIHAGSKRENPLVVKEFRGSVNDYGHVRLPAKLRNCLNCHVFDEHGRGTFELPVSSRLGSAIDTGSEPGLFLDMDPSNDLRITPIAAA